MTQELRNHRRTRRLAAVAVAFAFAAVVLWNWHRAPASAVAATHSLATAIAPSTIARHADARDAEANAHNDASHVTPASRNVVNDLPGADVPTHEAIATLLPLANEGRADAMRVLALRLMPCSGKHDQDDAALRSDALRRFYWDHGHEPATDAEIAAVAATVNNGAQRRDDCKNIDPALIEQRVDWLEKAGRGGNRYALLDYAGWALSGMGREDILRDPAEVERRRELAGDFLQRALAGGSCDALDELARAYSGDRGRYDWIYPSNTTVAYAYAQAQVRWLAVSGEDATKAQALVDHLATQLTSAAQRAAARQGEAIFQNHCAD